MDIPKPWVVSVERTTSKFGNVTINILMLRRERSAKLLGAVHGHSRLVKLGQGTCYGSQPLHDCQK